MSLSDLFRRSPRQSAVLSAGLSALFLVSLVLVAGSSLADGAIPRSERPKDAKLYLISPIDGEEVSSPFTVRFGLNEMGVAPAGVVRPGTGHHHLIIDAVLPRMDLPVPKDARHRHFGAGQTEVELELEPGEHTLQLLLGDHNHVPHDPPVVSERITVTVVPQPGG